MNTAGNDEIDIRKVLLIVWKRKFWIAGIVIITCIATVLIVLKMDNIYESRAVLRPTNNNVNQMSSMASSLGGLASLAGINIGSGGEVSLYNALNAIILDSNFVYEFVVKNKFEDKIFDDFDEFGQSDRYKENKKFFIMKAFSSNLEFSEDKKTGLITMSFQNKDREFTKKLVNALLVAVSSQYQTIEMMNVQERIDKYKNEIDKSADITLKNKLAEVVAGLIQNKVLSQAQEYYGFDIIVKPNVSDTLDKIKPRRSLICVEAAILSFILSVIIVLVSDSLFNKNREEA